MKIKFPGFFKKRLITFILISVGIFCLGCVLNFSGAFDYIEHKAYDARMNFTSRYTVPDDNICFVGVDQYSIDSLLQERGYGWPWPRSVYSEIVDFFHEAGAKCVAFDVFLRNLLFTKEVTTQFLHKAARSLEKSCRLCLTQRAVAVRFSR